MTPAVTVIIPLYNAAATVGDTVRSLLAQTLTDWRAIVVDDGSTDGGALEVERAAARDARFSLIRQSNRGLAGARNTGLAAADGRYIHFLDSDDWLLPRGLETLVESAQSGGGGGAACGAWELRDAAGCSMGREMPAPVGGGADLSLDGLLDGNRIAPHSHIIRRDLIGDARFDERLRVVEDLDMWLRLAAGDLRWRATDETVAAYRLRPGSLSKNPRLMFETFRDVLTRAYARGTTAPCDRSPARLARALCTTGLMYATTGALLSHPRGFAEADGLLAGACGVPADPRAHALSPADFGAAAFWALLFGLCTAPRDLAATAPSWRPALTAWWTSCRARGVLTGDIDRAWESLAAEAVDPAAVAAGLLHAARPRVIIAGYGRNGRALARESARRGLSVELRDDALASAVHAPHGAPRILPIDAPIPPGATVIATPLDDTAILARLPRGTAPRRWRDERARQTESLLRSLPRPAAAA